MHSSSTLLLKAPTVCWARACLRDEPDDRKTRNRDLWDTGKSHAVGQVGREPGAQDEPELTRRGGWQGHSEWENS